MKIDKPKLVVTLILLCIGIILTMTLYLAIFVNLTTAGFMFIYWSTLLTLAIWTITRKQTKTQRTRKKQKRKRTQRRRSLGSHIGGVMKNLHLDKRSTNKKPLFEWE